MTQRDLVAASLNVLGVISLVSVAQGIPAAIGYFLMPLPAGGPPPIDWRAVGWGELVRAGVSLGVAALLIYAADGIARRLVRHDAPLPDLSENGAGAPLLGAGIQVVGVVFAATAIPALATSIRIAVAGSPARAMGAPVVEGPPWNMLVHSVVMLLMGLALALYAGPLARWLAREPARAEEVSLE